MIIQENRPSHKEMAYFLVIKLVEINASQQYEQPFL